MLKKEKFKKLKLTSAIAMITIASAVSAGDPLVASISLEQTVGTDLGKGVCATDSLISVNAGTSVNFCYTVTNTGNVALELHDLDTSAFGSLVSGLSFNLEAGASVSVNDIRTLSSSVINDADWTANQAIATATPLTGPDFVFDDISATGTSLAIDDDGEANVVIPFTFNYFGTDSTDLRVGNNGAAIFNATAGDVSFSNAPLPTTQALLAPLWTDLADGSGDVLFEVLGTTPDQQLVVQWNDRPHFNINGDVGTVTFQMVLFETSNEIQFRYLDAVFGSLNNPEWDNGGDATIGLDTGDGVNAFQFSFNEMSVMDNFAISFASRGLPVLSATDSSSAAVVVEAPGIAVTPEAIDATVDSEGMGSETLIIENTGEGTLEWTVEEAAANLTSPKPISNYAPIPQANQSIAADRSAVKTVASDNPSALTGLRLGSGSIAYATNVRNNFFGTIDITDPAVFNTIADGPQSFFSGDFIGADFSTMYAIDSDDAGLYTLDTATGATTFVATVTPTQDPVNEGFSGMTYDSTTDTMYMSTTTNGNSYLYTIDVTDGSVVFVGEVTNSALLIDIAASPDGELFGFDIGSDSLIGIDKSTGAGTVIGAIGINANFAQGMDFDDSTNTLYIAAYLGGGANELRTVNVVTGESTLIGSVNPDSGGAELDAFAIATVNSSCNSPEDIEWLSLSETSGIVGSGDTDSVSVDFDASTLDDGLYEANLCVRSNDPDQGLVEVPVSLQVGPVDLIFANGFDEAPSL